MFSSAAHSIILAARWLVYLEMGCISEVTVIQNQLKARTHLAKVYGSIV